MIQLKVSGVERSFGGEPEMPLLWYLRDVLGLIGSKFGCGIGVCGAPQFLDICDKRCATVKMGAAPTSERA